LNILSFFEVLESAPSLRVLAKRLAGSFVDHRDPESIEHAVESLVKQRVYGIALGYEDLNDHDTLRLTTCE
jgi:Transposase DDE domain group 1